MEFRPTQSHANADGFSRLPLEDAQPHRVAQQEATTLNLNQINSLPLSAQELRGATSKEPVLSQVLRYTARGWPSEVPENLKPYHRHKEELSIEAGCLLRGMWVVIPQKLREQVLLELHSSHPGIVRMKGIAQGRVWWPSIDKDIEKTVQNCQGCQSMRAQPPRSPLNPWPYPSGPWECVHVDFAGPFMGSMFMVVVDAYSKWLEVLRMATTTASKTVEVLRDLFGRYGLPHTLVSDNGPQFTAQEFEKSNGIRHQRGAPYHPATNGEAERFV